MAKGGEKAPISVEKKLKSDTKKTNIIFGILYFVLLVICVLLIMTGVNFASDVLIGSYSDGVADGFSYKFYLSISSLVALLAIWLAAIIITFLRQNQLKYKIVWLIGLILLSFVFVPVGRIYSSGGIFGTAQERETSLAKLLLGR